MEKNKKIGIYCFVFDNNFKWDENNYEIGRIGGSEIWAIKVSDEFAKRGYDVYLFGNPYTEHVSETNVKYLNIDSFKNVCDNVDFDYIILSRTVKPLNDIKNCKNIYFMAHDTSIIDIDATTDCFSKIRKIFYQSEFQKKILKEKYLVDDEMFFKTFEAIDQERYDVYSTIEKKNKMLYSSGFFRGLRYFAENVFPKIKKEIPDFEVDVCGHFDGGRFESFLNVDGIHVLGNLTKENLIKHQCESKIWIYPNHGYDSEYNRNDETFCITAIENAYAKNACILGNWGCFSSTFEGYDEFVGNELYDNIYEPMDYEKLDDFANVLADDAIKCLKDEEYRLKKAGSLYNIVKKYTWEKAVNEIIELFDKSEKSVMVYVLSVEDKPYLPNDEIHKTVQLGAALSNKKIFDLRDDMGDNISEKNKYYVDCTGIYWVWKNSPKYDIIGTEAYRRHFDLSKEKIIDVLSKYDIIATYVDVETSIYEHYKHFHIIEDLESCEKIINDLYPQYGQAFSSFIRNETKLFYGNGYITTWDKFNDINNFIFSVFFELEKRYRIKDADGWLDHAVKKSVDLLPDEKRVNGTSYGEYQMRVFGYLYERLLSFYILNNMKNYFTSIYSRNDVRYNSVNLKTLLCCIGRMENAYIREFVEYYKNLGFTNICLYDNNRKGEEDFHDVIGDYIDSGYVILKNYRDITEPCQCRAYNECYTEYGDEYNWIAFFDIDEFLALNGNKSLNEYLTDEGFETFNMIHVNWLLFGDNGQVYNNGQPVLIRMSKPLDVNMTTLMDVPDTFNSKTIVRGGLKTITFENPHTPKEYIRCCNSYGIECDSKNPLTPYDFRGAYLLHFTTKTAEEFAEKVNRGFCDGNPIGKEKLINLFFMRNEVTKEKVDLFKERTGVDVSYLLPYDGEKNNDVKIFSLCHAKKNFKFLDDSVVTPLQVGADNGTDVCKLKDNSGDNISSLNYFYIESTGTYWIWKNVTDAKYKGQMQYRRPLEGVNETMDFNDIFSKYDVITCKPFNHPENSKPTKEQPMCIPAQTVEEGYKFSNCIDDLYILEIAVKYYFPEYSDDYDKYIKKGENLYYSNGFIMRSEDFDRYSEFLFGCLNGYLAFAKIHTKEELEEHVRYNLETGKYIRYDETHPITNEGVKWQTEIGGFLSERLWTLWVQHNFSHDRIYELPYIKMEKNMYT